MMTALPLGIILHRCEYIAAVDVIFKILITFINAASFLNEQQPLLFNLKHLLSLHFLTSFRLPLQSLLPI